MYQTTASMASLSNSTGAAATRTNAPDFQRNFWMYLASISRWAETEVNGTQVENGILNWMKNENANAVLDISGLNLRTLPPLPDNLKKLKAGKNALTSIPENHLPVTLEAIDIHGNQLTSLPESLPTSQLKLLNAANNKLTKLPQIAYNLNRECRVYLVKNSLNTAELTSVFGPEQNLNGMRQASSAAEFKIRQTESLKKLTTAIFAWMPVIDINLELFSKDISGMESFTNFLNQMQTAPFIKTASLCEAMAQIIKKTACNSKLCIDVLEHTAKSASRSTYQLARLFLTIKHRTVYTDIDNGLYNGRPADFVRLIRQEFRATAIAHYAEHRLKREIRELPEKIDELWGDIATHVSPYINLELEIELLNKDKPNSNFDLIELSQIIPNNIKDFENKNFAKFFSNPNSRVLHLLQIIDPKIKKIMADDTDLEGNPLQGEKLNEFHVKKVNDYFASIGQPDLLGQVWPTIGDPNKFSITSDQLDFNFSSPGDVSQLSPEQREQVEKCLIQ